MSFGQFLLAGWNLRPEIVLGCGLLLAAYLWGVRPRARRAVPFIAGLLLLALSLISPLDTLGDSYLFSAHMLQHLLLTQVIPPLVLIGLPPTLMHLLLRWSPLARVERLLAQPLIAWSVATVTFWLWHLPALYQAALTSEPVHLLEHLCFLVTGAIFWWPVIAPERDGTAPRLLPWVASLYLFAAMLASSLLGIIFTTSATIYYPRYQQLPDHFGLRPLLQNDWGLTSRADQQLGGALMWVIGGIPYFVAIMTIVGHWLTGADDDETTRPLPVEQARSAYPDQRQRGGW